MRTSPGLREQRPPVRVDLTHLAPGAQRDARIVPDRCAQGQVHLRGEGLGQLHPVVGDMGLVGEDLDHRMVVVAGEDGLDEAMGRRTTADDGYALGMAGRKGERDMGTTSWHHGVGRAFPD